MGVVPWNNSAMHDCSAFPSVVSEFVRMNSLTANQDFYGNVISLVSQPVLIKKSLPDGHSLYDLVSAKGRLPG